MLEKKPLWKYILRDVYKRQDPNFYLKHNFEKAYSDLGVPYIQEDCDLAASDNLIIYGHHIKGQKMFGALELSLIHI